MHFYTYYYYLFNYSFSCFSYLFIYFTLSCLLDMSQRAFLDRHPIKTDDLACHSVQEREQMTVPWKQRRSGYFISQTILHVITLIPLNAILPPCSVHFARRQNNSGFFLVILPACLGRKDLSTCLRM